jgi:hypothetical protein
MIRSCTQRLAKIDETDRRFASEISMISIEIQHTLMIQVKVKFDESNKLPPHSAI